MKKISVIALFIFSMLAGCSSKDNKAVAATEMVSDSTKRLDSVAISKDSCDYRYDTIASSKYKMHLHILDKFFHPEKRGYVLTSLGDTLNHFLYHQDIAAFVDALDPKEQGLYRLLTNKVIFFILEKDPAMLDYGLTQQATDTSKLNYFMEHVANPICNTIPIDRIIRGIEDKMTEPNMGAKQMKQLLLTKLKAGALKRIH